MTANAPSEELRVRVWEEMIAANMRSMYFARLAARERRIQKGTGTLATAFSVAACTALLGGAEVGLWLLWLTGPAAILGAVSSVGKYGESATKLVNCSVAWGDMYHRLQNTWTDLESGLLDRDDVLESLARVREHERNLDREAAGETERFKLLDRCHDQAIALASGAGA